MKVLIVRDRLSSGGGIVNYYNAIRPHLKIDFHFADVGKPHSFYGQDDSSLSFLLRFSSFRLLFDWFIAAWKILRYWPDIVHVNPGLDVKRRSLKRDAVNVFIARLLGRRVLVFWRGWHNDYCGSAEFPTGNNSRLCRIYKGANAHVVLSERFKEDLCRWGFGGPIYVETTVVDDGFASAQPKSPAKNVPQTNLLFLSRVETAKGIFELLEAYRILKQRNDAYTLTIAGDGPDLQELKSRVRSLEVRDVFFTGFVTGSAKLECYRRASVFCFLSYTEGMPNAVLEAMAMGLPLLSSDAGGLRDILVDGKSGFIVRQTPTAQIGQRFDPLEVADRIERMALDTELYGRISLSNQRYARERFQARAVAGRLETIYEAVIAGGPLSSALAPAT